MFSVEVISLLETIGLTSLLHSKNKLNRTTNQNHEQTAEAYLQIALYCRRILESRQSAEGLYMLLLHEFSREFICVALVLYWLI